MPIYDDLGLPRDNGATDWQDSARLAGIMATVGYTTKYYVSPLVLYIDFENKKYVRHPKENVYDFSRDQAMCFVAGLISVNSPDYFFNEGFVTGKDFMSPSNKALFKIGRGEPIADLAKAWIYLDVLFHALVRPMSESNQLICMLLVWPDKGPLKLWRKLNRKWEQGVREYWSNWRQEPELAESIIQKVKNT
jgi:hypothetical protein